MTAPRRRFPARLRVCRALAAASALLLAAGAPAACGEGREQARLAALEAGIASAQASLSALSPAARAAATAAPLPAGPRPLSASGLIGAGSDALRRWFGEPDLRRPEGRAEVQLFVGPACALDVVLYADGGGGLRVSHAAARADGAAAVTEAECLRGLGGGGVGRAAAADGRSGGR